MAGKIGRVRLLKKVKNGILENWETGAKNMG